MAFIKLKKPQEIVDNIWKIKKSDLVFVSIPKLVNNFTNKCFLIGTALADVEKCQTSTRFKKTVNINYVFYLLIQDKFVAFNYKEELKRSKNLKDRKLQIKFVNAMEYSLFMAQNKDLFQLKGF